MEVFHILNDDDKVLASSTPMLSQWLEIKESLGDEIVFCRVGDFFELFFDDAIRASSILDLQLTKRKISKSTYPMAGVPVRSLDTYVSKLIKLGYKVAIIDQLEDAKKTSGMLKRGLTKIITPGTITDQLMLEPGKNNYISSLHMGKLSKETVLGIAFCDISTGDFRVGNFKGDLIKNNVLKSILRFNPVEILYSNENTNLEESLEIIFDENILLTNKTSDWFDLKSANALILSHFNVKTTKGYGLEKNSPGISAAGALIKYLKETQFSELSHIKSIKSLEIDNTMVLDATAVKSLELFENIHDNTSKATLFALMNETVTPMGGRLLRHWMSNPLSKLDPINRRLSTVELFTKEPLLQHKTRSILSEFCDIERLSTRIALGNIKPNELIKLSHSLEKIPTLRNLIEDYTNILPKNLFENLDPSSDFVLLINRNINPNATGNIGDGNIIAENVNSELDRLRQILKIGEKWIDNYILKEQKNHNLVSMKIKQNNHLGYFIEISNKEQNNIPAHFTKKQVMINVTRYISEPLKEWETEIIDAELNIFEIEQKMYQLLLNELSIFIPYLQKTSHSIAILDCLSNFAYLADTRRYVKPNFENTLDLLIEDGRHPVIEALNPNLDYIPNNISLLHEDQRLLIITGPNFSGKSSLLRMVGLISIMAHMGSFVPANNVKIGLIDRIFTRIGASDNLAAGQSTFMLEMIDAANIVNNSTEKSLVIADELGRGTSTYDGLAIAWSIAEYLHNKSNSPKTLIATHYHQLSELEDLHPAVKNYQFVIKFENEEPIFDHKLAIGSSDKSFGVEVAKLSGLPEEVISRGRKILHILENKSSDVQPNDIPSKKLSSLIMDEDGQSSLENWFQLSTTLNNLTPEKRNTVNLSSKYKYPFERLSKQQLNELIEYLKGLR